MPQDQWYLRDEARKVGLVHCHYWRSNLIGSGQMLLSRYPIVATDFYKYTLCGKPQRTNHGTLQQPPEPPPPPEPQQQLVNQLAMPRAINATGDWEAGKGIGLGRVQIDAHSSIDVYTTHTIAQYSTPDEYFGHRVLETLEVVDFVTKTSKSPLLIV
jgi:sphingomyelin phosphodiesterase 2